jgi:Fic family protein
MVYVYKKILGDKIYYYLRASQRKGKKLITKDIAYLGSSVEEIKKNLDKLSKYKNEIRKAYSTINLFFETNYYLEKVRTLKLKKDEFLQDKLEEIEACKLHFNKVFLEKDNKTKHETLLNFIIEFAFNTASIEGNTINLEEARNLLQEGLTPKNKTLREIYDLQNTEKVFFELYNSFLKDKLDHDLIIKIHDSLLDKIDERKGYRTTDVKVIKSNFKATPAPYVKTDMDLLLKWYKENKEILHPFVLAIMFHHKFERIHPFMDGNGRTGRMLVNYILLKNNYPPLIIHKKTRQNYLEEMRVADRGDLLKSDKKLYSGLIQFSALEMIGSYWSIFV